MGWVISGLGDAINAIIKLILDIFGVFADLFVRVIANQIIFPLLRATIFSPFTLSQHAVVGRVALIVWETAGALSAAVALTILVFAVLSRLLLTGWTQPASWEAIGEGLAVWMAVLMGGWTFLNLLLGISNVGTQALLGNMKFITDLVLAKAPSVAGLVGLSSALFMDLLWPLSGLLLLALIVWCVGVWLMRQVDLVVYAGFLPLLAALGVGGNSTAFKWAWSEAMGAVFNQLAMAVILWVGFLFLGQSAGITTATAAHVALGAHVHLLQAAIIKHPAKTTTHVTVLQELLDIALAATTFTMAARAPQLLGNITGHHSAGSGHVMAGMALGYLGGRGMEKAFSASPLGVAASKMQEGNKARSEAQVSHWAGRSTLGERLGQSSVGQKVGAWASHTGEAMGERLSQSSVGQAAQAMADHLPEPVKDVAKNATQIAGQAVRGVTQPLRTAASMAYQPMTTLGRMTARNQADVSPAGPSGVLQDSQNATVMMAQQGPEAAASRRFGDGTGPAGLEAISQLGDLTGSHIYKGYTDPTTGESHWASVKEVTHNPAVAEQVKGLTPMTDPQTGEGVYRVEFGPSSHNRALYDRTKSSPILQNIPQSATQRSNSSQRYAMGNDPFTQL